MSRILETPLLFLVGGKGTRVQTVTNDEIPKPLIKITQEHSIIDLIYENLSKLGYTNFIFCIGHLGAAIETHFNGQKYVINKDLPRPRFSKEELRGLLGPGGAASKAIDKLRLRGPVVLFPGDMFLPWVNFEAMIKSHANKSADITFGVTSVITERTSDVGKILVEEASTKLIKCYGRDESVSQPTKNNILLTSAGVVVVDAQRFSEMYNRYILDKGIANNTPISIRDNILQWALIKPDYRIYTFDVAGEALDIGTEDRVNYARENWENYMVKSQKL